MRPFQPAVAALALAALVPLAGAADAAVPAAGAATSTATLASLTAVGQEVEVAKITATSSNVSGLLAKISVSPLVLNGADVVPGVTVTPEAGPVTVPSSSTPVAIAPIVSVSSPSLLLNAASGAAGQTSGLSTPDGLGSFSVLGLDLSVDGSLSVGSLVNATKADSSKTLTISNLALPSVADILNALGLDIAKLPADTLQALLAELDLAIDAAGAAVNAAVDDAQATIATAPAEIAALTASLPALDDAAVAAAAAAADAAAAFETALDADPVADALFTNLAGFNAASDLATAPYASLVALADAANAAAVTAATEQADAAAAIAAANLAIDTLQDALALALATIDGLVAQLAGIVSDVLSDTPLVSLGSASVGTVARVDSAKTAEVVGEVSGLEVVGVDVLDLATGDSTLDVAGAASAIVAEVNAEIAGVLGTLSSVLEGVAGVTFPAPVVTLLQKTTATGVDGAFGTADVSVSVLDISIPQVALPSNVVLDSVLAALPAELADNLSLVNGILEATGFALAVGTLSESARFRPAALTPGVTPPAPNAPRPGSLPVTGAPYGLALLAAVGVAGAVILRRTALARSEG